MQTGIGRAMHTCAGSGKAAPWDIPDSFGRVRCSFCGCLVRINALTRTLIYHEVPGAFRG